MTVDYSLHVGGLDPPGPLVSHLRYCGPSPGIEVVAGRGRRQLLSASACFHFPNPFPIRHLFSRRAGEFRLSALLRVWETLFSVR